MHEGKPFVLTNINLVTQFKIHIYLQLSSSFVHLVITQVHHKHWKCILGFFPHVCVTILQAGVEMRNTQCKIQGN